MTLPSVAVKHIAHISPGRVHGQHHESCVPVAVCPICSVLVIRWSVMEPDDKEIYVNGIKEMSR